MNKKAFTLIELVVWITISMLLMVSVGIFVNNWMANILTQQKVIENTTNLAEFTTNIHSAINLIDSWSIFPVKTLSWVLFKRWVNLWEWWFTYIWTTFSNTDLNWDWIYCNSWAETVNTKHVYIKNFIPFEEKNEDIFTDYTWSLISIKTVWSNFYRWFQKEHRVAIKKAWKWETIIWKWVFWDKFKDWLSWTWIYLNSPTWLAYNNKILFISDTLNNRILYYNTDTKKIYKLLDETDWLNEPTWLYYDSWEKALYISNSWNWEILKYSSKSNSYSTLTMSWITANNVNKIKVFFYKANWDAVDISWPDKWDVETNLSTSEDFFNINLNKLRYYFVNYSWTDQSINECNWNSWNEILVSWDPVKCTDNWTWQTSTYNDVNFSDSEIKIKDISNWFTDNWSYYINLKLYNLDTEIYNKYYPYFTKSDNDILTPEDNILEVYKSNLKYPTWIWYDSWIKYNEFWNKVWRDFNNINFSLHEADTILKSPIEKLDSYIENQSLTLKLSYYKKYNCYNIDDNSKRTYLFKKNLK